jgi:hypothetical protein
MIKLPETEEDLQRLVDDNVPEDVHLDYKASEALALPEKNEILKDISSFANSDGGIIIYGISEAGIKEDKKHPPPTIFLDNGIDSFSKCNKEWLERIIHNGSISPKIIGIKINTIPLSNGNYAYAIEIPKSAAAPHQSSDKKYYKRSNSQSNPMEHYEIEDVRNRSHQIESLVNIDVDTKDEKITLVISNKGNWIAEQVSFSISDSIKDSWIKRLGGLPTIFERGLKSFSPQKTYKFYYAHNVEIEANNEIKKLHIEAHYFHTQIDAEKTELFDFDFDDYNGSLCEYSPRDNSRLRIPHNIQSSLNNIISSIDSVAGHIREHSKLNGAYLSYFVRDIGVTQLAQNWHRKGYESETM